MERRLSPEDLQAIVAELSTNREVIAQITSRLIRGGALQPALSSQLTLPSNPMPATQGGPSMSQPDTPAAPQVEQPSTQQSISNQTPVGSQQGLPLPNQGSFVYMTQH